MIFFTDSRAKENSTRFYSLQGFHAEECCSFWFNREIWTWKPLILSHAMRILLCYFPIPICIPFIKNLKNLSTWKVTKVFIRHLREFRMNIGLCHSVLGEKRGFLVVCVWERECLRDNVCEVESGKEQPLFVWSSLWWSITRNASHYDECLVGWERKGDAPQCFWHCWRYLWEACQFVPRLQKETQNILTSRWKDW